MKKTIKRLRDIVMQAEELGSSGSQMLGDITKVCNALERFQNRTTAFVVNAEADPEIVASLLKKISGCKLKDGTIICLTDAEFRIYREMLPCPQQNP